MNFLTIEDFENDNIFNKKVKVGIINESENFIYNSIHNYLIKIGNNEDIVNDLQEEKYYYQPLIFFILEDSIKNDSLIKGLNLITKLYHEEPELLTFFVNNESKFNEEIDIIIENKFTTLSNNFYKYILFRDLKYMLKTNIPIIESLELLKEDYTQNNRIINGMELVRVTNEIINIFLETNELNLAIKKSYYSERSIKVLLKESNVDKIIISLDKILNTFKSRIEILNK